MDSQVKHFVNKYFIYLKIGEMYLLQQPKDEKKVAWKGYKNGQKKELSYEGRAQ